MYTGRVLKGNTFIKEIVLWSWVALAAASLYQYLFCETMANMVAVGIILLAWGFLCKIFLRHDTLSAYPFSCFLVIGFTSTQFFFPLIFTSLEGKAVVFNLDLPLLVFFHSFFSLLTLITAHFIYRTFLKRPGLRDHSWLERMGLFSPPDNLQVWIMGVMGLGATFYVWLFSPEIAGAVTGSALDKAIQGLIPFSYAPFFIPFQRMYGKKPSPVKSIVLPLLLFSFVLFLISLGRNSRGGFMIGFSSVGFAYALGLLLGIYRTRIFTLRNTIAACILVWLFTGPIADIGTAMVLVRNERSEISYIDLVKETFVAYSDKEAIKLYRENDRNDKTDWDETYVDNVIIARFSNLKFNDASLVQQGQVGEQDPMMKSFTLDYIWATLPQPFLDALGINIDKTMLKTVSFGDYLYYRAGASEAVLGGFRSGHFSGTGMAAFGWWYQLILFLGIIPVFFLFDKFFRYQGNPLPEVLPNARKRLQFSLCGMLALDSAFRFLPAESVTYTVVFIMRDWIQLVVLYLMIFYATKGLVVAIRLLWPNNFVQKPRTFLYHAS